MCIQSEAFFREFGSGTSRKILFSESGPYASDRRAFGRKFQVHASNRKVFVSEFETRTCQT
jgi:hypothetical protein